MKAVKKVAGVVIFLLFGVFLFHVIQEIFVEKDSYPQYRAWKSADDIDILVLGNSHADNGIRTASLSFDLSESSGEKLSVFKYTVYGIRIEQAYYLLKEIFKANVPDVIVLETFVFCPLTDEHRELLARRAFDILPLNRNKIEAVNYCVSEDRMSFYIPFLKYHSRWEYLTPLDIRLLYDESLWFPGGNGSYTEEIMEDPGDGWFQQEIPKPEETREITPSEKECLEKLLLLLEENNVQLLFVSIPYKGQLGLNSIEQIKINNYLREQYVNGSTIRMLDMNCLWEELDFDYSDLYNDGHVNKSGADKVTACLFRYLEEMMVQDDEQCAENYLMLKREYIAKVYGYIY